MFAGKHDGLDLKTARWPTRRPTDWVEQLNQPMSDETIKQVRESVEKGKPLGRDEWVKQAAKRLGLEHTLRGAGRPKRGNQ